MYQEIINYIGKIALKHKLVKEYSYKKRSMINQQNNHAYIQFVIEDNAFLQKIITKNVFTATINIDILAFPKDDTEVLELQSDCLQVGVEVLGYINQDSEYRGLLSVYDYDFLMISHTTDDSSCGCRLSLELVIPEPLDLCTFMDNFEEDIEVIEKPTLDLTHAEKVVPSESKKELNLKPIRLKTKK